MLRFLLVPVLASLGTVTLAQPVLSDSKSATWLDKNYVPCEGIGATGSGVIDVNLTYSKVANVLKVTDLQLRSRYSQRTARLPPWRSSTTRARPEKSICKLRGFQRSVRTTAPSISIFRD